MEKIEVRIVRVYVDGDAYEDQMAMQAAFDAGFKLLRADATRHAVVYMFTREVAPAK